MAMKIRVFFCLLLPLGFACQTPSPSPSAFEQGAAYAKAGALKEAKAAYETALFAAPTQTEIYRNLGIVEFRLGLFSEAILHLRYCMDHDPRDAEASFYVAEIFRLEEKLPQAVEAYKKAVKANPRHLAALQALAWSYSELHQYENAQRTVQQARGVASEDFNTTLIQAQIWIQQHQEKKALTLLDTVPQKKLTPQMQALWFSTRGKAYLGLKAYRKAYHAFRAAILKSPLLASALLGIGETYLHFGQMKEAKEYWEQAIHVNPKLKKKVGTVPCVPTTRRTLCPN